MIAGAAAPTPQQLANARNVLQNVTSELTAMCEKKALGTPKSAELLARAKVPLALHSLIVPSPAALASLEQAEYNEHLNLMSIARNILEFGCLHAIQARDIESFERYMVQLSVYYTDFPVLLPESPRRLQLVGLNLLALLARGKIVEFHLAFDRIKDTDISSPHVRFAMQLEQAYTEGSYSRIWRTRDKLPTPECAVFLDFLMDTVRNEIASCAQAAYKELPYADSTANFFFIQPAELPEFCKANNWLVDTAAKKIIFETQTSSSSPGSAQSAGGSPSTGGTASPSRYAGSSAAKTGVDTASMSRFALAYANELERIV